MRTRTVDGAGGVTLRVQEAGSGPPILLVHGISQSRLCWRKQFESDLTDDFRLVAMDLRGHGESEKPHDAYTDSTVWARDVQAVITELDLDDVVLVGWSYGGLVVLDYIEEFGTERLAGLHLVCAVSAIGTESAGAVTGSEYADLVSGFVVSDAEESVETMRQFVDLCVYGELSPEDRYFMLGYNVVVPPRVRDNLRSRTLDHNPELAALDVPALLTHGTEDAVVLPQGSRNHADRIDDAELSTYPETGHSPFWEQPDRFNRELRAFAERVSND